jgi:hypothetical protein
MVTFGEYFLLNNKHKLRLLPFLFKAVTILIVSSKFQSDEDQDMQNNCYCSIATVNNRFLKSERIILELYSFKATYTGKIYEIRLNVTRNLAVYTGDQVSVKGQKSKWLGRASRTRQIEFVTGNLVNGIWMVQRTRM